MLARKGPEAASPPVPFRSAGYITVPKRRGGKGHSVIQPPVPLVSAKSRALESIDQPLAPRRATTPRQSQMATVSLLRAAALGLVVLASALPSARPWSKEGHVLTCQIAQVKTNRIVEAS